MGVKMGLKHRVGMCRKSTKSTTFLQRGYGEKNGEKKDKKIERKRRKK